MERLYYIKNCLSDTALYIFKSFDEAFNWCKKATNWDDEKIKAEIKIANIDDNMGYMAFYK